MSHPRHTAIFNKAGPTTHWGIEAVEQSELVKLDVWHGVGWLPEAILFEFKQ